MFSNTIYTLHVSTHICLPFGEIRGYLFSSSRIPATMIVVLSYYPLCYRTSNICHIPFIDIEGYIYNVSAL